MQQRALPDRRDTQTVPKVGSRTVLGANIRVLNVIAAGQNSGAATARMLRLPLRREAESDYRKTEPITERGATESALAAARPVQR